MNSFQKSLVIAVASLGAGSAALAASDSRPASTDGGSHWGAFGSHGANFAERIAKRQAALHDKLNLSPAQEPAWKAFTDKLQATAPARPEGASTVTMTAPERADRMVTFLQAAQQRAAARAQAVKEFYSVLSPEQQKIFDSQFHGRRYHHFGHG
jgi:Spy/CpxP family protein refolding chaperone